MAAPLLSNNVLQMSARAPTASLHQAGGKLEHRNDLAGSREPMRRFLAQPLGDDRSSVHIGPQMQTRDVAECVAPIDELIGDPRLEVVRLSRGTQRPSGSANLSLRGLDVSTYTSQGDGFAAFTTECRRFRRCSAGPRLASDFFYQLFGMFPCVCWGILTQPERQPYARRRPSMPIEAGVASVEEDDR